MTKSIESMSEQLLKYKYDTYLFNQRKRSNKGMIGRDSEKKKTYRAEWNFQAKCYDTIIRFNEVEEAQRWAKRICKTETWKKLCQQATPYASNTPYIAVSAKERNTGRGNSGYAQGHSVVLDRHSGFDLYTLLHEMAHCAGHRHHGRTFRKAVLTLVSRFIGREQARILKACFKERGLSTGEARKPMSFEKWKKMYARAEAMRAERFDRVK